MIENIGYQQVEGELTENENEVTLVEKINKAIDAVCEETQAEIDNLQATALETLKDVQLAAFLSKTFFPGNKALSYSQCINNPNIRFSMRAALQLLKNKDNDEKKYNANGVVVEDASGKTIDERLMGDDKEDGISNKSNNGNTIVKILQTKVGGAVVDGKPGPQTISRIIGELGGNTEVIYNAVNTYYGNRAGGERFNVKAISKFPEKYSNDPNYETIRSFLGGKSYSYDSNKFDLLYEPDTGNGSAKLYIIPVGTAQKVEVTINNGVPTAEGYDFTENGWIIKKALNSDTGPTGQEVAHQLSENDIEIDGNIVIGGKGKELGITDINSVKYSNEKSKDSNLFVIDSMGKLVDANLVWFKNMLAQDFQLRGSGTFKTTYNEASNAALNSKFTYSNGNLELDINNTGNKLLLERQNDASFKIKYGENELPFNIADGYQALRVSKLIALLMLRCGGSETGADKGNPNYYLCTTNDSPFFVGDDYLYWSDHGGVTDTDILSINTMGVVASEFQSYNNRINFAKFLSRVVEHTPDDEGIYQNNDLSKRFYPYIS